MIARKQGRLLVPLRCLGRATESKTIGQNGEVPRAFGADIWGASTFGRRPIRGRRRVLEMLLALRLGGLRRKHAIEVAGQLVDKFCLICFGDAGQ